MKKSIWAAAAATALLLALVPASAFASTGLWDEWEQAHGISVIKVPGKGYDLIWASEYKRGSTASGDWTHDVFGRTIRGSRTSADKTLVAAGEAQEPASSARTTDGHILVTFEDGYKVGDYGIMQRYAIFDDNLKPVVKYQAGKTVIGKGAHSGHTAAMGNMFVTAYDMGWVDKDGIKNQGTGKSVCLHVMNSTGTKKKAVKVMASKNERYDWPVIAASSSNALMLWQKIVPGQNYTYLMAATYNGKTGKVSKAQTFSGFKCKYYNYSATYVASAKRYLVTATDTKGKGHVLLFSQGGKLLWHGSNFPAFQLDTTAAVNGNTVAIPAGQKSLALLKVGEKSVKKVATKTTAIKWERRGQAGYFPSKDKVVFFSLGAKGLRKAVVSFGAKKGAAAVAKDTSAASSKLAAACAGL